MPLLLAVLCDARCLQYKRTKAWGKGTEALGKDDGRGAIPMDILRLQFQFQSRIAFLF